MDGINVVDQVEAVLEQMKGFTQEVRSGNWKVQHPLATLVEGLFCALGFEYLLDCHCLCE